MLSTAAILLSVAVMTAAPPALQWEDGGAPAGQGEGGAHPAEERTHPPPCGVHSSLRETPVRGKAFLSFIQVYGNIEFLAS